MTKIVIGSDHVGYQLKEAIKKVMKLKYPNIFEDYGTDSTKSCDYPDVAHKVAVEVSEGDIQRAILICETGIGMSIVANRYPFVRASVCSNVAQARATRAYNDSNILCLGARFTSLEEAIEIIKVWMDTKFEGGRHERRIDKIEGGLK